MMDDLTTKQWAIVSLIADGNGRDEIAAELDLSATSVREAIRRLCDRFGCEAHELPRAVATNTAREG
jgi:DNA-binding NarL/FixJ family response regulator